jgi:hypothetical protein
LNRELSLPARVIPRSRHEIGEGPVRTVDAAIRRPAVGVPHVRPGRCLKLTAPRIRTSEVRPPETGQALLAAIDPSGRSPCLMAQDNLLWAANTSLAEDVADELPASHNVTIHLI